MGLSDTHAALADEPLRPDAREGIDPKVFRRSECTLGLWVSRLGVESDSMAESGGVSVSTCIATYFLALLKEGVSDALDTLSASLGYVGDERSTEGRGNGALDDLGEDFSVK